MKTRLTQVLGVEHPVMLAGMGGVSYSRLAAAVSEAGGYGCLGASTMSQDQLVDEMASIKSATTKPFAVDLLGNAGRHAPFRRPAHRRRSGTLRGRTRGTCRGS